MNGLSVVIITRNEENNIVECIRSARKVSGDIIVVDTGSEDSTTELAADAGATVFSIEWNGYGHSRNFGAEKAKHPWILSLDADERISDHLGRSISQLSLSDTHTIYRFRRKNFLAGKTIRFGTLGFEKVSRIYHRDNCSWDLTQVHEKLLPLHVSKKMISGHIDHFGLSSHEDHRNKSRHYAQMSAEKYLAEGRKPGMIKKIISPAFNSVKSFLFLFGFLDGIRGLKLARTIAYYSWLKYHYLQQLHEPKHDPTVAYSGSRQMETVSN